jgi:hypothetical protein
MNIWMQDNAYTLCGIVTFWKCAFIADEGERIEGFKGSILDGFSWGIWNEILFETI